MAKRLLIIAYAFPPAGAVGAQRPLRMVKYLNRYSSWKTTVITARLTAQTRIDHSLLKDLPPDTSVHSVRAVEPWLMLENFQDSLKHRLGAGGQAATAEPSSPAQENRPAEEDDPRGPQPSLKQYFRDFLTTPDPQFLWNLDVVKTALQAHQFTPFDAVMVTSPPWSLQFAGFALSKLLRIPWIADYRDPWTDIDRLNRTAPFERWNRRLEDLILPQAASVVSTSDTYSGLLAARFPEKAGGCFQTIYNGFDEDKIVPRDPVPAEKFTVVHLGSLYDIWSPYAFFYSYAEWLDRNPERRPHCRLLFVGKPSATADRMLESLGLSDVAEITGHVAHARAISECQNADMLLLALSNKPGVPSGWLPSKLFEYLAFNRPIIADIGPGEAQKLIDSCGGGFCVTSEDKDRFMEILERHYQLKQQSPQGLIEWENNQANVQLLTQQELTNRLQETLERVTSR
jgi:glycosyltransferase involved in cell wall biosynthesis